MQRAEPDERAALARDRAGQPAQVAEIADAPVALRAQAVELHRRPPDLGGPRVGIRLLCQDSRHVAAGGGNHQQHIDGFAGVRLTEGKLVDGRESALPPAAQQYAVDEGRLVLLLSGKARVELAMQ